MQAAGREQMGIAIEVGRFLDRRIRQAEPLAFLNQVGLGVLEEALAHLRQVLIALAHALLVADLGQRQQVGKIEVVAEDLPLRIRDDANEDLLVVAGIEYVVDRPRLTPALGHRQRLVAGHGVGRHVLGHQERAGLEQARLDAMALAGLAPLEQRGQDRDHAEHAAHDVVHRSARAQGAPLQAGHVGKAGHHLDDFVERGAMLVGSLEKALRRHVDQARVVGL